MKQRDISIDILKFFAALIITNSHMELLYGDYKVLPYWIKKALFSFAFPQINSFLCRVI